MKKITVLLISLVSTSGFCGGLDPYIPLQTKQIDGAKMMRDSERMSQIMLNDNLEREKSRIYKAGGGDPDLMLELASKSKYARQITPYFQDYANQQQVYELNRLKMQQEIDDLKRKNSSEPSNKTLP